MIKNALLKGLSYGLLLSYLSACSLLSKGPDGSSPEAAIELDTMDLEISPEALIPYRPAAKKVADISHLELDLSFDLASESVFGQAKLFVSAYARPIDTLWLDAKSFDIKKIELVIEDSSFTAEYNYQEDQLSIILTDPLTKSDTIAVEITYVAHPTQITSKQGSAITSNQGLYFINPKGTEANKPIQIWSQGEPESNSSWFPSIDKPHEKFTQEIFLTVDSAFKTISNGELMYSSLNDNGTRTDYWKQDLPHSNYLVMIAVGEFEEVEDSWEDLKVNYYVDKKYVPHAHDIFGNTPEMLTYYSDLLGYRYPWAKYHQVVVKDFVSGAMENTSAVIHGDFVQQTKREMLDGSHEDVIAHELFHHWFGDIVTCETWSQITLNEGFATYGEYLWNTHKYGEEEAKYFFQKDLVAYVNEATSTPKRLIRHHYINIDDVFDSHSYQKGGRVLHMLRKEIGDDLFFESLNKYLVKFQYSHAEIDDFRLLVEEVTGRDLKWFFDQWYHEKGHPIVSIEYNWIDSTKALNIQLVQTQNIEWPTFKFHLPVSIGLGNTTVKKSFWVENAYESFQIPLDQKPTWVLADAMADMLWEVEEKKDSTFLWGQLSHAPLHIGRNKALNELTKQHPNQRNAYCAKALEDPFWLVRAYGLSGATHPDINEALKKEALQLAKNDKRSLVRAQALSLLDSVYRSDSNFIKPFIDALSDSSYTVIKYGLEGLVNRDPCLGAELCLALEKEEDGELEQYITSVYAQCGDPQNLGYFITACDKARGVSSYVVNTEFTRYAAKLESEAAFDALINGLTKAGFRKDGWYVRYSALNGLSEAEAFYISLIESIQSKESKSVEQEQLLTNWKTKLRLLQSSIEEIRILSQNDDSPFQD